MKSEQWQEFIWKYLTLVNKERIPKKRKKLIGGSDAWCPMSYILFFWNKSPCWFELVIVIQYDDTFRWSIRIMQSPHVDSGTENRFLFSQAWGDTDHVERCKSLAKYRGGLQTFLILFHFVVKEWMNAWSSWALPILFHFTACWLQPELWLPCKSSKSRRVQIR